MWPNGIDGNTYCILCPDGKVGISPPSIEKLKASHVGKSPDPSQKQMKSKGQAKMIGPESIRQILKILIGCLGRG